MAKNSEMEHKPGPEKIDILPTIKELATGIVKGNTTDVLGAPIDLISLGTGPIYEFVTGEKLPTQFGSSEWFRSIAGVEPEDASLAETAGTLVSAGGLSKAMILPFMKLAKTQGRTAEQQAEVAQIIREFSENGASPADIFSSMKGYLDKNAAGMDVVKGVMSDKSARIDENLLDQIEMAQNPSNPLSKNPPTILAKDILNYPEFFDLYPEAGNIKIIPIDPKLERTKAQLTSVGGKPESIALNPLNYPDEDYREVLLHELQHVVQRKEGWKGGASPRDFISDTIMSALEKAKETAKPAGKEDSITSLQDNIKNRAYKKYEKVAGEQEARFTQFYTKRDQKQLENQILKLLERNKTPSNRMD